MKKILTLILLLFCVHAFAQDSLKSFNNTRIKTTSSGLEILGAWGIANIGTGAIFGWGGGVRLFVKVEDYNVYSTSYSTSQETKYFFQMNAIWGVVNFGTALISYGSLQKTRKKYFTAAETLKEQQKVEKIFLINGALDIGYIGTGLYLKLTGDSRNSPLMKGYGESILLQGGFLLIFDGLMYNAEKHNGSKLRHFLEKNPITFDGRRVGIIFNM